jgi:hypothetical protein
MRIGVATALLLIVSTTQATATTIDFEQFSGSVVTFEYAAPELSLNDGYVMSSDGDDIRWMAEDFGPSSTMEILLEGVVTFSKSNGSAFNLGEFDYAFAGNGDWSVTLSGVKSGGSNVSLDLTLSEIDGRYSNYSATSLFTNIVSFSIQNNASAPPMALDNIVLTAVPVPAAVWLFGSALAGLGWLRRKQST